MSSRALDVCCIVSPTITPRLYTSTKPATTHERKVTTHRILLIGLLPTFTLHPRTHNTTCFSNMHRNDRHQLRPQHEGHGLPRWGHTVLREPFHTVPDSKTIQISAQRLKRWHKELERVNELRRIVNGLDISRRDERELFRCTESIKKNLETVKSEVVSKLRS